MSTHRKARGSQNRNQIRDLGDFGKGGANMILRRVLLFLLKCKIKETEGLDNIPAQGPFIIAANHISFLDPFFISVAVSLKIKKKIYFLTALGILKFWKGLKKFFGMIPASAQGIRISSQLLKRGSLLCIFPEGRMNVQENLIRGKRGVAEMAISSGAPVIPVGYVGPASRKIFVAVKNLFFRRKKIKIIIGRPMQFKREDFKGKAIKRSDFQKISDQIMKEISELCGKPYPY